MSPRGTRLCHALYGFVLIGSLTAVVATGAPRAETCAQPASLLLGALIAQPGTTAPGPPPPSTMVSTAVPVLRIVPVNPPPGADPYPPGTAIFGEEITFPGGAGPTKIWLEIKLSGWGTAGLRGFHCPIKRVADPGCPWPPCPCMAFPYEPPCKKAETCKTGPTCPPNEKCPAATLDSTRFDFVFAGMTAESGVDLHDPDVFIFHAELVDQVPPAPNPGGSYAGAVGYYSWDFCPGITEFAVGFDSKRPPTLELGDGSKVIPQLRPATIRMLAAPPDDWLPGNNWWYMAIFGGFVVGLVIGAVALRRRLPSKTVNPRSPHSPE